MYVSAAFEAKLPPTRQDLVTLTPNNSLQLPLIGILCFSSFKVTQLIKVDYQDCNNLGLKAIQVCHNLRAQLIFRVAINEGSADNCCQTLLIFETDISRKD